MKIITFLVVGFVFAVFCQNAGNQYPVEIFSISTRIGMDGYDRTGSLLGGTRIFIKINGHDTQNAANNQVTIGPYTCDIPDKGVNELYIQCVTGTAEFPEFLHDLEVKVQVVSKQISICSSPTPCTFSFTQSKTPVQLSIVPRVAPPNTETAWYGYWLISNTNQIDQWKIDDQICGRLTPNGEPLNLNPDEPLDITQNNWLTCITSPTQVGGYYTTVTTQYPGQGDQSPIMKVQRSTVTTASDSYDFKVQPVVNSVSSNVGSTQGQIIDVSGNGFGGKDNTQVKVGDKNCNIISIGLNSIKCEVDSGDFSAFTDLTLSQNGLKYQKFNMSGVSNSPSNVRTKVIANSFSASQILATGVLAEPILAAQLDSNDAYETFISFYLSGYFKAPYTGDYVFAVGVDDQAEVWLQTSGSSTDRSTMTKIAYVTSSTKYLQQYQGYQSSYQSAKIALVKDKYYYIETYATQGGGFYYLNLGVTIPNPNALTPVNSVPETTQIKINYTPVKEVIVLSVNDNDKFTMDWIYIGKGNRTNPEFRATVAGVPWNADEATMANYVNQYSYQGAKVISRIPNLSGTTIVGYKWEIQFDCYRPTERAALPDILGASSYTVTQKVKPSAPVRGTYKLNFLGKDLTVWDYALNDYTTNIQYWRYSNDIRAAILRAFPQLVIQDWSSDRADDGQTMNFRIFGYKDDVPDFIIDDTLLTGDSSISKPTVSQNEVIKGSKNYFYEIIENELLWISNGKQNVIVYTNGASSVCLGDCSYAVDATKSPSITSFTYTEATGALSVVVDVQGQTFASSDITVEFAGTDCVVAAFSSNTIACNIAQVDSVPKAIAGSYTPRVHFKGIGFASGTGLTATTLAISVTSTTPLTSFTSGDSEITIVGNYFPFSKDTIPTDFSVKINNVACTIVSVSNTQIMVTSPAAAAESTSLAVVIAFNGQTVTASNAFAYSNVQQPIVSSLSPLTASPVLKGILTINGNNFDTSVANTKIFLDRWDKSANTVLKKGEQPLGIKTVTNTQITAVLSGGTTGDFKVRIVIAGKGASAYQSTADYFTYNIVLISSSPSSGSYYGGTIITITGQNFSPQPNENNVFIDNVESIVCPVIAATTTQIKCQIPEGTIFKTKGITGPRTINVMGRLLEEATWQGTQGTFEYSADLTPRIGKLIYNKVLTQQLITLTGSQLSNLEVNVLVDGISIALESFTVNQVIFKVPLKPAGVYTVQVQAENKGFANSTFQIEILGALVDSFPKSGSRGGRFLTLQASGLNPNIKPKVQVGTDQKDCPVQSWNETHIFCRGPAVTGKQQVYAAINPEAPLRVGASFPLVTCDECYYTGEIEDTPSIAPGGVSGATVSTPTEFTISLSTGIHLSLGSPKAYLEPVTQKGAYINFVSSSATSPSDTTGTAVFANVPSGKYNLLFEVANLGFVQFNGPNEGVIAVSYASGVTISENANIPSSLAGKASFTVTGSGFSTVAGDNTVTVCGLPCEIISSTYSQVIAETPLLVSPTTVSALNIPYTRIPIMPVAVIADNQSVSYLINDGGLFNYYTSTNTICFVKFDFGTDMALNLQKFEFYPHPVGLSDSSAFGGIKLFGSNDDTTWTQVMKLPDYIHIGRNQWKATSSVQYRYYKIEHDQTGLTNKLQSKCELAEVQFYGYLYYKTDMTSISTDFNCPVAVNTYGVNQVLTNTVTYQQSLTAEVTKITPIYGPYAGGTVVTFTGARFGSSVAAISVTISGVVCSVNAESIAADESSFTCTTGALTVSTTKPSVVVTVGSQLSYMSKELLFYYSKLWSDVSTWGGEPEPADGDSFVIKKDTCLAVDHQHSGVLSLVMVEAGATLLFADNKDLTFDAEFIMIHGGKFIIGSEVQPYTKNLVITLHGNYWGPQLPDLGNKVIGCHQCQLDIHGIKIDKTWTQLDATAAVGATSIILKEDTIGWKAGDEIVIASSDFYHGHAERRTIETYTSATKTITFKEPLIFKHYGDLETHNGKVFDMRAEVGLLTRNIKIKGDDDSQRDFYGAHLIIHGDAASGTQGRISHTEFYWTGQPKIIGRYPIHFHMNGDVEGSYSIGNAVHDSFARVTTIHAVQNLVVKNTVGFHAYGHMIFLEDGIEQNNYIQDNLMISALQSFSMLQTDITPANFWITNPLNHLTGNHAAGSDFYGMWYEFKEHPDGPSATTDICPQGMPLGTFSNNVGHSNSRFGLRIFVHTARRYPCLETKNIYKANLWEDNPTFQQTYGDFTAYKNQEDGILAEFVGNLLFTNIKLADNHQSGFNIYYSNSTKEEVILEDAVILAKSNGNAETDIARWYTDTRGVITPQSDGFYVKNAHFKNFPESTTIFKSCSQCWHIKKWNQGGKLTRFSGITYDVSVTTTKFIFWENWRREIYHDVDGSLTKFNDNQARWITPYAPHLQVTECSRNQVLWDDASICTNPIYKIDVMNAEPHLAFASAVHERVLTLDGTSTTLDPAVVDSYTKSYVALIKNHFSEQKYQFNVNFVGGHTYKVHFNDGIDFSSAVLNPSYYFPVSNTPVKSETVVLKFNYTDHRETFDLFKWVVGDNQAALSKKAATFDINSSPLCSNGDYHVDETAQLLTVCVNGVGKVNDFEKIKVEPVICRNNCPSPGQLCTRKYMKNWASDNDWIQDGVNYKQANNYTIPCEWIMVIDTDNLVIASNNITIQGKLVVDVTKVVTSLKINAKGIFIAGGGEFVIGTPDAPFTGKAIITLEGLRNDPTPFIIDDQTDVGNKVIGVIGTLQFYGLHPENSYTRLAVHAKKGDTTLQLIDTITDWKVDDEIALAPTGQGSLGALESEKFTITAIDQSTHTVTINSAVQYFHQGGSDDTMIRKTLGGRTMIMDLRATVSVLTRNIVIQGSAEDTWGCRMLVTWLYKDKDNNGKAYATPINYRGLVELDGVEFNNCGQRDQQRGAIDFRRLEERGNYSLVSNVAIHDCIGLCMVIEKSQSIKLRNSIFYKSKPIHVFVEEAQDIEISGNLFVAAIKRDYEVPGMTLNYDPIAALYWISDYDHSTANVKVTANIVQGTQGMGLTGIQTPCSQKNLIGTTGFFGFYDNSVATCEVGFLYTLTSALGNTCQWAGRQVVARSDRGFMINPTMPGIEVEQVMSAENTDGGLVLRFAHEGTTNYGFLRNSWIAAIAYPDCTDCYTEHPNTCKNKMGIQMFTVTQEGEKLPLLSGPKDYDIICTPEVFDLSGFIIGVTFENFRLTYKQAHLSGCKDNFVMTPTQGASDATGGQYLSSTKCVNCERNALIHFRKQMPNWIGWAGGCGIITCTGLDNILVQDMDSSFFGAPQTAISHNAGVGEGLDFCTKVPAWNDGYICDTQSLGVLEFESIAPDKQTRSSGPVVVLSDEYPKFKNTINLFREWSWDGPEPLNLRMNRFTGIVPLGGHLNISYNGLNPYDIIYKIQHRQPKSPEGNNGFTIIKVNYQVPLAIQVLVNGVIIPPYRPDQDKNLTAEPNICGKNIYFPEQRDIHFGVNLDVDCLVQVRLIDVIKVNLRLSLTSEEFFSDTKSSTFTDRLCAMLKIPTNRLRIVSASNLDAQARRQLQFNSTNPDPSSNMQLSVEIVSDTLAGTNPTTSQQQLDALNQTLFTAVSNSNPEFSALQSDFGLSSQITSSMAVAPSTASDDTTVKKTGDGTGTGTGTEETSTNTSKKQVADNSQKLSSTVIIVLVVISTLVVLSIAIGGYFIYKKKLAIQELLNLRDGDKINTEFKSIFVSNVHQGLKSNPNQVSQNQDEDIAQPQPKDQAEEFSSLPFQQ